MPTKNVPAWTLLQQKIARQHKSHFINCAEPNYGPSPLEALVKTLFITLIILVSSSAFAGFPQNETEPAALAAFQSQLTKAGTALNGANARMLKSYSSVSADDAPRAITLTQIVTRSNVYADILVREAYVNLTAGGDDLGSLTAVVHVELETNADTGRTLRTKARVDNASIKLNLDSLVK